MSEIERTDNRAAPDGSAPAGPVTAGERIAFVDVLRGFAIFGILVINIRGFSGTGGGLAQRGIFDQAVILLGDFLVQAKFYSLFSFLFGWGMALQLSRAQEKGARFLPLYLRRLAILLVIGILHGVLLWRGDILTTYALLGFLLLLFRNRSPRFILIAAGLSLLFTLSWNQSFMVPVRDQYNELLNRLWNLWGNSASATYESSSFIEVTRRRAQEFVNAQASMLYYAGNVFSMFLLGLYVGKRKLFRHIEDHWPLVRRTRWVGLVIGVLGNGIFVLGGYWSAKGGWPDWIPAGQQRFLQISGRTVGAPALMLFYVSSIILLMRQSRWRESLQPLAAVGRTALSNYLLQSVIFGLIFYGYGLGLYGEVYPTITIVLIVLVFLGEVRLSRWWMTYFRFGLAEWLWRTLTYGRRQPLLRDTGVTPVWLRRMQDFFASGRVLAAVWVVLVLWAAALGVWYVRLTTARAQAQPPAVALPAETEEGASDAAVVSGTLFGSDAEAPEDDGVVEIIPPDVQPVSARPGPLVQRGDLQALAQAFDVDAALAAIETLTGPPYLGRRAGTPGGWAAGDFIAQKFEEYGLQPAGDDGTFFQSFPVDYSGLETTPQLVVTGPDGAETRYEVYADFAPAVASFTGEGVGEGEVVWANQCQHDDFDDVVVVDKIVFCRTGPLEEAGRNAIEHGAAGLLLLADPEQRPLDFGVPYRDVWVPAPLPTFYVSPAVATELVQGSGKTVADLSITFDSFPLASGAHLEVDTTTDAAACVTRPCRGRNVLGVLPGRDPAYAGEVVILGAHYDHMGQAPDGTAWVGANDDASGVAAMLEIARTWHEQGFVPQRTVLFAAWDAEELGLVGSEYYVRHRRYRLQDTVAMIQLDMVGAGSERLVISDSSLSGNLRAIVATMGISTTVTGLSGSDHTPFLQAGVPASLLIWLDDPADVPDYHRPSDTIAVIEPEKLEAAGEIAGLGLLHLAEAEPEIETLLAQRAAAVEQGDETAFLRTSAPGRDALDRQWFDLVRSYNPITVTMTPDNLQVAADGLEATVTFLMVHGDENDEVGTATLRTDYDVRFVKADGGWRWAGPELAPVADGGEGPFTVLAPPATEESVAGLGQQLAGGYAALATPLGLPAGPDVEVLLYPDEQALRTDTAAFLPAGTRSLVAPGTLKLIYTSAISHSTILTDSLTHLLLANAGVTEQAAPWLWQGLAPALARENDPAGDVVDAAAWQAILDEPEATEEEPAATDPAPQDGQAAWAAVDYLQQQVGWEGVGAFIADLGAACRRGECGDGSGLDAALNEVVGMDAAQFHEAWRAAGRQQLDEAQAALDAVLAARTEAVLAGDETAFLGTVDATVPHLRAEQQGWFAALRATGATTVTATAQPLALYPDDRMLADVVVNYVRADGSSGGRAQMDVRFTPGDGGLQWSGAPFAQMSGPGVQVLFPAGEESLAQTVLSDTVALYPQIAADLGVDAPTMTVKVYANRGDFLASISPAFHADEWLPGWTAADGSVKLVLPEEGSVEGVLAIGLTRHLLREMGVGAEWLLKGVAAREGERLGVPAVRQILNSTITDLLNGVKYERLPALADILPDRELAEEEWQVALAQAGDALAYLAQTQGEGTVRALLRAQAGGASLDEAMQAATGQSLTAFEAGWRDSVQRGHVPPEWVELAAGFDEATLAPHLDYLTDPALAGRQAGSPGAEMAAAYIAEKFEEYGLRPAGDPDDAGNATYFQRFAIQYLAQLAAPHLAVGDATFVYREEFLTLLDQLPYGGEAAGELVLVRDGSYAGMDLAGKVVVRDPDANPVLEMQRALEHGAGGLILVGDLDFERDIKAKAALPITLTQELTETIPVLVLTRPGYGRLLDLVGHTPVSFAEAPPALPLGVRVEMAIPLEAPRPVETANVLGLLPGSDPALRDEFVIVGAHYDHVGDDPDVLRCDGQVIGDVDAFDPDTCERIAGLAYSGLNDNATGVAVMLEMARLWQESGTRPGRSVLFAAWGAQEPGEVGSRTFVQNPTVPLSDTVGTIQLDAVGGGEGYYLLAEGTWGREGRLLFGMTVAEELLDGRLKISTPSGQSDDVAFRPAGVPTILVTWTGASEANWPDTLADEIEPDRLRRTGQMVFLTLLTLAE